MASEIPIQPGAYLLLIELMKVTDVKLSNIGSTSLVQGDTFTLVRPMEREVSKPERQTHATSQGATMACRPANQDWRPPRVDISGMQ